MTPQEKAIELVCKFGEKRKSVYPDSVLHLKYGKQCALIAVDEVLIAVDPNNVRQFSCDYYTEEYWQEVKQEIEKL